MCELQYMKSVMCFLSLFLFCSFELIPQTTNSSFLARVFGAFVSDSIIKHKLGCHRHMQKLYFIYNSSEMAHFISCSGLCSSLANALPLSV